VHCIRFLANVSPTRDSRLLATISKIRTADVPRSCLPSISSVYDMCYVGSFSCLFHFLICSFQASASSFFNKPEEALFQEYTLMSRDSLQIPLVFFFWLLSSATLSTGTINHIHIMTELPIERMNLGPEDNIRYERRALSIRSKHHYIHPIRI
jgi:hypothetical protein